jgi:hypothetical protein
VKGKIQVIDPKKMIVLWDTGGNFKIIKLKVVDIRNQTSQTDKLPASAGACDAGWMEGDVLQTPFGLYAWLSLTYGFPNRKAAMEAALEFAKVEGQTWVQELQRRQFGE